MLCKLRAFNRLAYTQKFIRLRKQYHKQDIWVGINLTHFVIILIPTNFHTVHFCLPSVSLLMTFILKGRTTKLYHSSIVIWPAT